MRKASKWINFLGLEEQKCHFHPVISRAFSGKNWVQICGGQHHTVALDSDGEFLLTLI
jgi:alpha-tubulin suppressor-like RCC1 family protein